MISIYPNLIKKMNVAGMSIADLARHLNLSEDIMLSKFEGLTDISLNEAIRIGELLHCDDLKPLFTQEITDK